MAWALMAAGSPASRRRRVSGNAVEQQVLVLTLTPGDVVSMDNLGVHKMAGVWEAIEAVGARLLIIPPYSLT
jgi:transposase